METKRIVYFLFTIFILLGCDKKPKFEIYENHEISACGIIDPLKNSQWLSEFIEKNMESTNNITIYLYSNSETKEENIVIDILTNDQKSDYRKSNTYVVVSQNPKKQKQREYPIIVKSRNDIERLKYRC